MYKRCISVCLILLLSIQMYGCNPDVENVQSIPINGDEEVQEANPSIEKTITKDMTEELPESRILFGKWRIDKAVLWSEMYTGTIEDGVAKEDLFDPESFIGYELEYSHEVFRLGDKEYENPQYLETYVTLEDFNQGGKFKTPDVFGVIIRKNIR